MLNSIGGGRTFLLSPIVLWLILFFVRCHFVIKAPVPFHIKPGLRSVSKMLILPAHKSVFSLK